MQFIQSAAAVALFFVSAAPLATAQTRSRAFVVGSPGDPGCAVNSAGSMTTTANCPVTLTTGGFASASSSADASSRTARATASATQTGTESGLYIDAIGRTATLRALMINGAANPGDSLVFHFQTTELGFLSPATSSGLSYADYFIEVEANGSLSYHDVLFATCCTFVQQQNATSSPGFVHLAIGIGGLSNTSLDYIYRVFAEGFLDNDVRGASADASIEAYLASIDAKDSEGNVRGTAIFGADGNATLDLSTVVPEPATLPLLATGLGVFATIARRRRRTV